MIILQTKGLLDSEFVLVQHKKTAETIINETLLKVAVHARDNLVCQ